MTLWRTALALLLTPVATVVAVTAGRAMEARHAAGSLLELVADASEAFSLVEGVALFAAGMLLRLVAGPAAVGWGGPGPVAGVSFLTLSAVSLADLFIRERPHNLLGIEWLLYALFAGVVWLGFRFADGLAGRRVR